MMNKMKRKGVIFIFQLIQKIIIIFQNCLKLENVSFLVIWSEMWLAISEMKSQSNTRMYLSVVLILRNQLNQRVLDFSKVLVYFKNN